ncbi:hypothetical protein HASA104033_12115 [Halobacterium salinarum]|uniref:Uncharacterized protein n=1 Tax=Halobacterium salinarum (strain ATCC 33171 / DSM 3754 / JCM 8978 / NBRC 102687 / NCIMB 764 / 91-R6) TaxID=2597657 RepID=A0A663A5N5_HALS9|nr:hypothetical protein APQ99_02401 [Halobacterium salinarum DSM 3754]
MIGDLLSNQSLRNRLMNQLNSPDRSIASIQYVTLAREIDLTEFEYSRISHLVEVDNYAVWERDRENQEFVHRGGELAHQDLVNCLDNGFEYGRIGAPSVQYLVGSHPILALEEVLYTLVADHRSADDDDYPQEFGRVAKRSRVCLWCSQLRGHSSLLFWSIAGAIRRGTTGSTLGRRTSPAEAGVSPLIPPLSSASTGSYSAC